MYQRILVPVDGSHTSTLGLQEAIRMAIDQRWYDRDAWPQRSSSSGWRQFKGDPLTTKSGGDLFGICLGSR